MKKTTTINLNSVVYNIDEDAYDRLNSYLDDLRSRLDKDVADEVMEDIEARVGELFSKNMNQYKTVAEMADVERVIETLGDPESFGPASKEQESTKNQMNGELGGCKIRRKFYRDGENKVLGGVASGVAAALNWDVTLVRVLFFVCLLVSFGWATLVYILLWIIVPEARTVAQKLEMQGIDPSAQNISDYSQRYPQRDAYANSGNNGSVLGTILKILGALILIPIIVLLLVIAFAIIVAILYVFGTGVSLIPGIMSVVIVALTICGIAGLAIPIAYIVWLIVKKVKKEDTTLSRKVFVTWLIVWLFALVAGIGLSVYAATDISGEDVKNFLRHFEDQHISCIYEDEDDDNMISEVRCDSMVYNGINVEGAVHLDMVMDTVWFVEVKANGERLRNVNTTVEDGELTVSFKNHKNHTAYVVVHTAKPVKYMNFKNGTAAEVNDLTADTLYLSCKNGSALDMENCNVEELSVDARNGAAVEIDGNAKNVKVVAKNGAAVDISGLKTSGRVVKEADIASNVQK